MFDERELNILLRGLEDSKARLGLFCIYCELVDNREEYTKTRFCKERCAVCDDIEEIDSLIFKIGAVFK